MSGLSSSSSLPPFVETTVHGIQAMLVWAESHPYRALAVGATTAAAVALIHYWRTVKRFVSALQNNDPFRMVRVGSKEEQALLREYNVASTTTTTAKQHQGDFPVRKKARLVELDPGYAPPAGWKLMSLGDYLSSLRPGIVVSKTTTLPDVIELEIQAALAGALSKSLGPYFGTAVLPALGFGIVERTIRRLAVMAICYFGAARNRNDDRDRAGLPLSLAAMSSMAEFNYERIKREAPRDDAAATTVAKDSNEQQPQKEKETEKKTRALTSLELLKHGEVGFKPCFHAGSERDLDDVLEAVDSDRGRCVMLPNPFVLSEHWAESSEAMEQLLQKSDDCEWKETSTTTESTEPDSENTAQERPHHSYDPHSKDMSPPVPINERFLPDLHLGWGSAKCTHTQREILHNRLLSVLLNRLASNYCQLDEPPFQIFVDRQKSSQPMTKPPELIQALIQMGHKVESCVGGHTTTFGAALCVREEDGTWTNIPLGYFLQNGYADAQGQEAFCCLPHSGLNLEIRDGPLIKHGSIQHYLAIDGLCGWHSNHDADVPWFHTVYCGEVMHSTRAAESVRVAGLEAVVLNTVGTKFDLPHGGYGLTGVCNDSAGLIEYALSKKTHVYPLTFNGLFAMQNFRIANELKQQLLKVSRMKEDVEALNGLIEAIVTLPSDINSLPSQAREQCQRQLHCIPNDMPFSLMRQNDKILRSILKELDQ